MKLYFLIELYIFSEVLKSLNYHFQCTNSFTMHVCISIYKLRSKLASYYKSFLLASKPETLIGHSFFFLLPYQAELRLAKTRFSQWKEVHRPCVIALKKKEKRREHIRYFFRFQNMPCVCSNVVVKVVEALQHQLLQLYYFIS